MDITIMPHLFPFAGSHGTSHEDLQELEDQPSATEPRRQRKGSVLGRLQSFRGWLKRDEEPCATAEDDAHERDKPVDKGGSAAEDVLLPRQGAPGRRGSRDVVPGLPRPQTFRRQNSEKRERLLPVEPTALEKRAVSEERRYGSVKKRMRSPALVPVPSISAPEVGSPELKDNAFVPAHGPPRGAGSGRSSDADGQPEQQPPPIQQPPVMTGETHTDLDDESEGFNDRELQEELDAKWILNLSMHFRDKSDREKFFVTYAQEPNRWRRVTVSCDYRNATGDSLEADLKSLHFQRDKSLRIYEAIRESLPDIQFYETVTNLKLETEDGRLHVHVTEDINEIIKYPSTSLVEHLECPRYQENELHFESHLSGFVYKVAINGRAMIKKEIPGPDTVDEFIYEINALESLRDSESVIRFLGVVIDETGALIKGLLISYACGGALVDLLYDFKDSDRLSWLRREKWARQIVTGLSEIHEAGFVQGDFTLSNIVIDEHDDAKIIDINRRGCPVGWEPPELLPLIMSGQRISMCIGTKSDLYQLGMVLWALGAREDEPERQDKPFRALSHSSVPAWFDEITQTCLSQQPKDRASATELLRRFERQQPNAHDNEHSLSPLRSHDEYIDPDVAVDLADIDEHRRGRLSTECPKVPMGQVGYARQAPLTADDHYDSSGSYITTQRGRRGKSQSHGQSRSVSSATSISSANSRVRQLDNDRPRDVEETIQKARSFDEHDSAVEGDLARPSSGHVQSPQHSVPPSSPPAPRLASSSAWLPANTAVSEAVTDSDGRQMTHPVEWFDGVYFRPPAHQDSGFGEGMLESLILNESRPTIRNQDIEHGANWSIRQLREHSDTG